MSWRPALSLVTLRDEVNTIWPNRDKASDGMIGDPAHAATASDHNPNQDGVVCAFDITHDPVAGPDIAVLFNLLRTSPHPDCKYLIANRRIASRLSNWEQRMYTGADPHTSHIHVSVGVGPDGRSRPPYDDLTPPWLHLAPAPPKPEPPTPEDDEMANMVTVTDSLTRTWVFWLASNDLHYRVGNDVAVLPGKWAALAQPRIGPDGQIYIYGWGTDMTPWGITDDGNVWGAPYPLA